MVLSPRESESETEKSSSVLVLLKTQILNGNRKFKYVTHTFGCATVSEGFSSTVYMHINFKLRYVQLVIRRDVSAPLQAVNRR